MRSPALSRPTNLVSAVLVSKPWRPDPANVREEIWLDHANRTLYVDFRKSCDTCLRIGSWERGLPLWRWENIAQYWQPDHWDPGIPLLGSKLLEGDALHLFASGIPPSVADVVRPFEWRQFTLLRMVHHRPETVELLQSNPALALLLADTIGARHVPVAEESQWVLRRRREILSFCTGVESESAVRILAKIRGPENRFREADCTIIRNLLANPALTAAFRHVKAIPIRRLHFAHRNPKFCLWLLTHTQVWNGPEDDRAEKSIAGLWADTQRLGMGLGIADTDGRICSCGSIASLRALHDEWARALNARDTAARIVQFRAKHGTTRFPDPPLPGNEDIRPVTSFEELAEEGMIMHNCVASYAEKIMAGLCHIYRVLAPERATLEVAREDGEFQPAQLKTAYNGNPSNETRKAVEEWMELRIAECGLKRAGEESPRQDEIAECGLRIVDCQEPAESRRVCSE